jgi:hypothetical protein
MYTLTSPLVRLSASLMAAATLCCPASSIIGFFLKNENMVLGFI